MHLSGFSLQYPYRVNREIYEAMTLLKNKRHMAHIKSYQNPETNNRTNQSCPSYMEQKHLGI